MPTGENCYKNATTYSERITLCYPQTHATFAIQTASSQYRKEVTMKEKRVLHQQTTKFEENRSIERNFVLQSNQPNVEIKQEFENFGCFRAGPKAYLDRYGSSLRHTECLKNFRKY